MSRLPKLLTTLALGAAMSFAATSALAQHGPPPPGHGGPHHGEEGEESEYPVSYVERPLTLSRLTLAPELELSVVRESPFVASVNAHPPAEAVAGLSLGATFGITRDFEISAVVLPLELNAANENGQRTFRYGSPILGATFRFYHSHVLEVGARLQGTIYTESGATGALITPSVPLLFHLGTRARIDTGVALPITARAGTTSTGLQIPFALAVDVIEPFHLGVNTGLVFEDIGRSTAAGIPLGFFGGWAFGRHKPIVDLDAFFRWDSLVTPNGNEKFEAGVYEVGLAAKAYLYF